MALGRFRRTGEQPGVEARGITPPDLLEDGLPPPHDGVPAGGRGPVHLLAERPGLLVLADKGYVSAELDAYLQARGAALLRPSYRSRAPRPGQALLAPIRQLIESVYDTLKGQLDLELHGGRSLTGVTTRIAQRLLALTAAIWHNRATGQPVTRSLIAYDH